MTIQSSIITLKLTLSKSFGHQSLKADQVFGRIYTGSR